MESLLAARRKCCLTACAGRGGGGGGNGSGQGFTPATQLARTSGSPARRMRSKSLSGATIGTPWRRRGSSPGFFERQLEAHLALEATQSRAAGALDGATAGPSRGLRPTRSRRSNQDRQGRPEQRLDVDGDAFASHPLDGLLGVVRAEAQVRQRGVTPPRDSAALVASRRPSDASAPRRAARRGRARRERPGPRSTRHDSGGSARARASGEARRWP